MMISDRDPLQGHMILASLSTVTIVFSPVSLIVPGIKAYGDNARYSGSCEHEILSKEGSGTYPV